MHSSFVIIDVITNQPVAHITPISFSFFLLPNAIHINRSLVLLPNHDFSFHLRFHGRDHDDDDDDA
jgi:hypothetical protein